MKNHHEIVVYNNENDGDDVGAINFLYFHSFFSHVDWGAAAADVNYNHYTEYFSVNGERTHHSFKRIIMTIMLMMGQKVRL